MTKYYGAIGFASSVESSPDVWTEEITERNYYGDVIRNVRRLDGTEFINDKVVVNSSISIVADAYAKENYSAPRYAPPMASNSKVPPVEVQPPRLILTLGGVYNE